MRYLAESKACCVKTDDSYLLLESVQILSLRARQPARIHAIVCLLKHQNEIVTGCYVAC